MVGQRGARRSACATLQQVAALDMSNPLILGHLTVLDQPPPEVVSIAADIGFTQVGLRILASRPTAKSYPLWSDPPLRRETIRRLHETGVTVFDVDVVQLTPQPDFELLQRLFTTAAELGAKSVLVTCGDPDRGRFEGNLARFCELASPFKLAADLEFMLFTPTVPDLKTALDVVESVRAPNLGVLVDTIHFDRTGSSPSALRAVPRDRLNYIHLTDARAARPTAAAELMEDSRAHRLIPGEGALDLVGIIEALPADLPLCVEVSNAELDKSQPAKQRAARAYAGARALLTRVARH